MSYNHHLDCSPNLYPLNSDGEADNIHDNTLSVPAMTRRKIKRSHSNSNIESSYHRYRNMQRQRHRQRHSARRNRFPARPCSPLHTQPQQVHPKYMMPKACSVDTSMLSMPIPPVPLPVPAHSLPSPSPSPSPSPFPAAHIRRLSQPHVLYRPLSAPLDTKPMKTKRRTRTFYSKKWGNRLYVNGLIDTRRHLPASPPPCAAAVGANCAQTRDCSHLSVNVDLRRITISRPDHRSTTPMSAFMEEETLDLHELQGVGGGGHQSPDSPTPTPQYLGVDYGMMTADDGNNTCYDSAVSLVAANTDIDRGDDDDEDERDERDERIHCAEVSVADHHHYHHEASTTIPPGGDHNFKIVVSSHNEHCADNGDDDDEEDDDDARERHLFEARLRAKRHCQKYIVSEIESAGSDCYSSTDDDATSAYDDDDLTDDDVTDDESARAAGERRQNLFLGGNSVRRGVYSTFSEYSGDSDTDDQSDDFGPLTICYRRDRDRNNKNIRFRNESGGDNHHLQVLAHPDATYLSDIGQSDIGSDDTDCCSSADSIPDSIPPPIHSNINL